MPIIRFEEPRDIAAIRYYPRFGFVPASRFGIKSKYDTPDEHFMAIELREGALQNQAGMARYQPEFDEV